MTRMILLLPLFVTIFCGTSTHGQYLLPDIMANTTLTIQPGENSHAGELWCEAPISNPDNLHLIWDIQYSTDSTSVANGFGNSIIGNLPPGMPPTTAGGWTDPLVPGATYYLRIQIRGFSSLADLAMLMNDVYVPWAASPIILHAAPDLSTGILVTEHSTRFVTPKGNGLFEVSSSCHQTLRVTDASGKTVYTEALAPGQNLIAFTSPPGMCIVSTDDGHTQKIFAL